MKQRETFEERSILSLIVTGLFLAVTVAVAIQHEPWFDEAQGWLLARDSSLWTLIWHNLRYEGSPGLWHLLLWFPAHLGLPYAFTTGLSVVAATISCFLLVKFSPFPLWVRVFLPFSFYLGYQYAVIARSYVLFPPLLFGIAILYPNRHSRPIPFFVLLALLSNVSSHGILVACGIAFVHLLETAMEWKKTGERPGRPVWVCYGGFAVLMVFLAAILWPPADIKVFTGNATRDWFRAITWPLSEWGVLSLLLYLASMLVFMKRGVLLLFVFTWGPVALLFTQVFRYSHDGLLFLIWLFTFWVAMASQRERTLPESLPSVRQLVSGVFAVILVFQLFWYAQTVSNDWSKCYSGAYRTAHLLHSEGASSRKVYGWGMPIMSILPYFQKNIFYNYNGGHRPCYWQWTKTNPWNAIVGTHRTDYSQEIQKILTDQPDVVVIGIKNKDQGHFPLQLSATKKYRMVHFFKGYFWYKAMPDPDMNAFCVFHRIVP